ncbi:HD-GYP domain-containing protein [Dethiothermospora halolimnae]|uniref:HD-GYP domain-containing protein n=1 Tax=Dethiothermospora halolimnae TaxID=3114390 RepID=UPI003CCBFAF6
MNNKFSINLTELLSSLSLVLDIGRSRCFEHSRRTAYISYCIGKKLFLDKGLIEDIYYTALIHDIGMTGHLSKYTIKDVHHSDKLKREHCEIGAKIITELPISKDIQEFILYHHEQWDGSGVYSLKGEEIPLASQILHVADYFDLTYNNIIENNMDKESIRKYFKLSKGASFNPLLVDCLIDMMEGEKFWFDIDKNNLHQVINTINPNQRRNLHIDGLIKIAKSFSKLIDSKSKFTSDHSMGICNITEKMAKYIGYDEIHTKKLVIAALLHDLGKLIVPNEILEKPSKLSKKEFDIVKSHPYYTKLILSQIKGLEDIANWAGNHHEKLNGKGYPERLDYKTLTDEDRIIAVSDIYQALTEDRPYRKGLSHNKAVDILKDMANKGFICGKMVNILDKSLKRLA